MPTTQQQIPVAQQQSNLQVPDMRAIYGQLMPGEAKRFYDMFEERMNVEAETRRLLNEQRQLQIENERTKQSLIAKAIESAFSWQRGGEPVDVGEFQGKTVSVGRGGVKPFGSDVTPPRATQPGGGGMAQELLRTTMGLPAKDPEQLFEQQMTKQAELQAQIGQREEARAIAQGKREDIREVGREKRQETRISAEAAKQEKAASELAFRQAKQQFSNEMRDAQREYNKKVLGLQADPIFKTQSSAEQKSQLQTLRGFYESWLTDISNEAGQYGIKLDLTPFKQKQDPSVLSKEQIEQYRALPKKKRKIFDQKYEQEFGKPVGIEGGLMASVDEIFAQLEEKPKAGKKAEYKPAPGEEAIFARQPGVLERMRESGWPGAIASGMVPFSEALQGRRPGGWTPENVMEGIGWASGFGSGSLMRGDKSRIANAIKKGLFSEPASMFEGKAVKPGMQTAQETGMTLSPRSWTMREPQTINIPDAPKFPEEISGAIKKPGELSGAIERKMLQAHPRGEPTIAKQAPVGPVEVERIPTPAERLRKVQKLASQRAMDAIEELLGQSLKAKGWID